MIALLRQLYSLFDQRDRRRATALLAMMFGGAGLEALGTGLIVPFLGLLGSPDQFAQNEWIAAVARFLEISSHQDLVMVSAAAFLAAFVFKNVYLLGYYYFQYKFVFEGQVSLGTRLLEKYLATPYDIHTQRNSADLLRNINQEVPRVFNHLLLQILALTTEIFVVGTLVALLVVVEPLVAPAAIVVFGLIGGIFFLIVRRKVSEFGVQRQESLGLMIRWINQGLGGIKETKILGNESYFLGRFEGAAKDYADSSRYYRLVQVTPRFFIETIGIGGMLAILLLLTATRGGFDEALPIIGLFAMVAVRLMPSITRVLAALTSIRHFRPALEIVANDLSASDAELSSHDGDDSIAWNDTIDIIEVSYRYPGAEEDAIRGVSLSIPKGSAVAFAGPSGSGKTTLVDIVLGLLQPKSGRVALDGDIPASGRGWQSQVGYIAQPTYLLDGTIRENVAFGIAPENVSDDQVWRAIESASLRDFIESLPKGLDTEIGEHGARISGGQRQRLGIARALYRNPDVLILDEATSALDPATERAVTEAIAELQGEKTLISIAHRLETIAECDRIFFLTDGELRASGTLDELMNVSDEFRAMANRLEEHSK